MKRPRRGIILVLVLIVVTMLALGSLGFAELMVSEHRAAQTSTRQSQARSFAETGQEIARQFLDRYPDEIQTAGGLYDNASRFSDQLVAEDTLPRERGKVTFVAPIWDPTGLTISGGRPGLDDESGKINLATIFNYDPSSGSGSKGSSGSNGSGSGGSSTSGTAAVVIANNGEDESSYPISHQILMALPGMTDEIADSILNWCDPTGTVRPLGADSDYYNGLSPPYSPRNGTPASIEELLLVQGVTPELLYGLDAEKMGYSSSDSTTGLAATDGSMDHGWAAYLTLWSAESTFNPNDGTPKINVNQSDMPTLYSQLVAALPDPKWAEYIVFYRQGGGTVDSSGNVNTSAFGTGRNTIGSMLDLVGIKSVRTVTANGSGSGGAGSGGSGSGASGSGGSGSGGTSTSATSANTLPNPFTTDSQSMQYYLPILFDTCTTVAGTSIPGRININTAPLPVLMSIPGMTQNTASQILSARDPDPNSSTSQSTPYLTCPAWPLMTNILTQQQMQAMLPYITAGGSVYRAQIIGRFDKGNPVARVEVILDATQHPARVLFWKDMSHLTNFRFSWRDRQPDWQQPDQRPGEQLNS